MSTPPSQPGEVSFRNLQTFLLEDRRPNKIGWQILQVALVLAIPVALFTLMFQLGLGGWFCIFGVFGVGAIAKLLEVVQRRTRTLGWRNIHMNPADHDALDEYRAFLADRSLAKRTAPAVALEIEGLAATANGLRQHLHQREWMGRLPEERRTFRKNVLQAIDETMLEALREARPYVRSKGMRKRDFAPTAASAETSHAFLHIRALRRKLASLADSVGSPADNTAHRRLDILLADLHETKRAQAELDEHLNT